MEVNNQRKNHYHQDENTVLKTKVTNERLQLSLKGKTIISWLLLAFYYRMSNYCKGWKK